MFTSAPISKVHPQKKQTEVDKTKYAFSHWNHRQFKKEVKTASLLAHEGHLTEVKYMFIANMDISEIPHRHIDKLASIVTDRIDIFNITPVKQLGSILASVQCPWLQLVNMELSKSDTRALVTAMRERVQSVSLSSVTLDVEALATYNGRGRCNSLSVYRHTRLGDRDRLREWAEHTGWTVTWATSWGFEMGTQQLSLPKPLNL